MDLKTLNKEILFCRAAVKKARVAIIRKLIKKIKILKSCKKQGIKEKRNRKAERLYQRVQIMKKAKEDEVTRFALRNIDLDKYMNRSKIDIRQNALAHLAKHNAVLNKVNAIREKIPNWEVELPQLLNLLGKKSKIQKKLGKGEEENKEESRKERKVSNDPKHKQLEGKKKKSSKQEGKFSNIPKQKKLERQKQEAGKQANVKKEDEFLQKPKIKKIDDPFFMGKKVIAPKILDLAEELKNKKTEVKKDCFNKSNGNLIFNAKPFKIKKDSMSGHKIEKPALESEERLHPSWAAKKVKLIRPFEGKKIKFSDE